MNKIRNQNITNIEGKIMKSFISKMTVSLLSALLLAAVVNSNAYAELVVPSIELPGIVPASYPNFENSVKLKVKKNGKKGYRVKIKKKGSLKLFNLSSLESYDIKGGNYKLIANFDPLGNFLDGTLQIKGKIKTDAGKIKGVLMTATLGDFAYDGTLLGWNTHNIVCSDGINALIGGGGCTENESVYIDLEKLGFDPTNKGFKSKGLSIASVPVPAAVWLFGSGLFALAGIARRRKL